MWRKRVRRVDEIERNIGDPARSRERTMNRAIKLLAAKPRSVSELRKRLLEKTWTNEEIVADVLGKLEEYGYLDDERYARDLALSRLRRKPQGIYKLRHGLSRKELSDEHVERALRTAYDAISEDEMIASAIEKRICVKGNPQTREEIKKLCDYLLRQGFSYQLIRVRLDFLLKELPDDDAA